MSREFILPKETSEILEVIKEEQCSPILSSTNVKVLKEEPVEKPCVDCTCLERDVKLKEKIDPATVEKLLQEKEKLLTKAFEDRMKKEMDMLKERCDFILQNEQIRATYMLREAHRDRQEKILALQTQLECKNMAGLMFVICTERRKSKLEKMRLIQEYTNYIRALQDILMDAQAMILHLSRGYKTAARVDYEWRSKMRKVLSEFQMFVHDFAGGTPEEDQFFFNVPELLKTEASIVDNPTEDPCEDEEEEGEHDNNSEQEEKPWWERMGSEHHPFLVFGDMAEFKPPQRREVLHTVKAAKTAPKRWKEYVFSEMFIKSDCVNADVIKDEYPKLLPTSKWECSHQAASPRESSKMSLASRRVTRQSEDIRGNMGSILKIMTSNNQAVSPATKATLLGARDSMEIASTTKLRGRHKQSDSDNSKVVINIGKRRASFFDDTKIDDFDSDDIPDTSKIDAKADDEDDFPDELSALGSIHNDSLQVINQHVPEQDHKIHYEKVCPMEKCQRLEVDSFIRSLPPYMRANPFTHYEQNYEEYEACSPEQLEILKQRLEQKKEKGAQEVDIEPLAEWTPSVEGVAAQTSELSMSLPPCTCRVPSPSLVSSEGRVYRVEDLLPVKEALDEINRNCLFDDRVQFDRFKVLGQESKTSVGKPPEKENTRRKVQEISNLLRQHPSFLDIFQANT